MNEDVKKLREVTIENKFQAMEKYISHLTSKGFGSKNIYEKKFKFDFEKYVNEDVEIDWKSEFPNRFKSELKDGFFIRQIDFIDVLSYPKATEHDVQKIILENNISPHLDENGNPHKPKSQTDLESMRNKRKFSCYGIDKEVWFHFQQEGFIFDDLPDIPRRSLCIPFEPGMNGAWAPNGYGKSFIFGTVFQTLRRSFSKGAPVESFERFLTEISALTNQKPEHEVPIFSSVSQPTTPLIPFRQIAIGFDNHLNSDASFAVLIDVQFDEAASVESYSLSLDMGWSPGQTADYDEAVNIPRWIVLSESSTLSTSKFTGPSYVERIRNLLNANTWELVALTLFTQFHLTYVEIPKLAYNANMFGEIKQYVKDAVSDLIRYKPAEFCSWPLPAEVQALIYQELQEEICVSIGYNTEIEEISESEKVLQIQNMIQWCFSGEAFKEAVHLFLNRPNVKGEFHEYPGSLSAKNFVHKEMGWEDADAKNKGSALMDMYEDVHDYLTNKIGDTLYLCDAFVEDDIAKEPLSRDYLEPILGREWESIKDSLLDTSLGRAVLNDQGLNLTYYEYIKDTMKDNNRSTGQNGSLEELLHLVSINMLEIIERIEAAVSKKKIIDFERSLNSVISTDGPWGIKLRLMNWGSNLGTVEPLILHQAEDENQRVSWSQLSFGQKSELIIEGVLAKEQQESRSSDYQRCLVIDEPEAGRSEHWTNELIHKLSLRGSKNENGEKNSVLLLSHRGLLLSEVFHQRGYNVMHYVDIDDAEEE